MCVLPTRLGDRPYPRDHDPGGAIGYDDIKYWPTNVQRGPHLSRSVRYRPRHRATSPHVGSARVLLVDEGEINVLAAKFWPDVNMAGPEECWEWARGRGGTGYGGFYWKGLTHTAHRIAFMLAYGSMPEPPNFVLHRCDNPACCNPRHLYPGTKKQNSRDMVDRGRHKNG